MEGKRAKRMTKEEANDNCNRKKGKIQRKTRTFEGKKVVGMGEIGLQKRCCGKGKEKTRKRSKFRGRLRLKVDLNVTREEQKKKCR